MHILDTRKYAADCEATFGHFLHHFPYLGLRGADDMKALASAFDAMQQLYLKEFGEPMSKASAKRDAAFCAFEPPANAAFCAVEPPAKAAPAFCAFEPPAKAQASFCAIEPTADEAAFCAIEPTEARGRGQLAA